jgi:hypothetical protein
MVLHVFKCIQTTDIQDNTIRYKWDDWNVEQAEEPIDEDFYKRLEGISQRANIAFTIGTAEWIIYRFGSVSNDSLPIQYLEAAWAQIVHWRYAGYSWNDFTKKAEWSGPVRGPLDIAMTRVMFAIQQAEADENPELRAAWITNLAQYLMANPTPYRRWCEWVMERLESLYRRDPEEKLGEVVPREALDPDFDLKVEKTESLINRFLGTLDYNTNPFLSSPEKMLEQGYEGRPYIFDIEKDRKARFEW